MVKTWNTVDRFSFGSTADNGEKIAVPVSVNSKHERKVVMQLVADVGFAPVESGTLNDAWRQQFGNVVFCTDLNKEQMQGVLPKLDKNNLSARKAKSEQVMQEILEETGAYLVGAELARAFRSIHPEIKDIS